MQQQSPDPLKGRSPAHEADYVLLNTSENHRRRAERVGAPLTSMTKQFSHERDEESSEEDDTTTVNRKTHDDGGN